MRVITTLMQSSEVIMKLNEFMNTYGEKYEKYEMIWHLNKKYKFSFAEAEKYYCHWRKAYLNSRIEPKDIKPIERKPLENVVVEYANRNSKGISLEQLKTFIYYKKLGIKSMDIINKKTGMTEKAVQSFYVKLHHSGYKVGELENFDFNKISV